MEKGGITDSKNLRIQVIMALCFGGLYALLLVSSGFNYQTSLYSGGVLLVQVLVGARLMSSTFRYFQPKTTFSFVPIVILVLLNCILSALFYALIIRLPSSWQPQLYEPSFWIQFTFLFFIYWILFYEWWFSKNEDRNANNTRRLLELQEDLKNAEIKNIQQNVHPHFLFNSLNSISSLTLTAPDEAQKMVVKLSDFLRHSVVKNQNMFISLKEELEQIERYLSIEQIRFSNRLRFQLEHDKANDDLQIPSMLLQPLIENAIKYGLYGQIEKADILMTCERQDNYLLVVISNPIDEQQGEKKGTGFGLSSIRKKLYLLFAESNLLTVQQNGKRFETHLKIPLRDESNID